MQNRDKQNEKNLLVLGWEFAYQNDRPCIVITEQIGNEIYILGSSFESAGIIELKGYRKSTDLAEEIFAEIDKRFEALLKFYPCNGEFEDAKRFVDFHWKHIRHSIMCDYDAELKKKYTEEGK